MYCIVLYYNVYCIVLYCVVLCCMVLYWIGLDCIVMGIVYQCFNKKNTTNIM